MPTVTRIEENGRSRPTHSFLVLLCRECADDIVRHVEPSEVAVGAKRTDNGAGCMVIVELGCGDGSKTSLLINAAVRKYGSAAVKYWGIDVSGGALVSAKVTRRVQPNEVDGSDFFPLISFSADNQCKCSAISSDSAPTSVPRTSTSARPSTSPA